MSLEESRTSVGYAAQRPQAPGGVVVGNVLAVIADETQIFMLNTAAADRTLTLPAASTVPQGWSITVQRRDPGAVNDLNIATAGGDTVNGAASPLISTVAQAVFVVTRVSATDWVAG